MSKIDLRWEPRSQQVEIRDKFAEVVNNKTKFLFVDAPVGIGKSYAIMMMAEIFQRLTNNEEAKFDTITNTKILQEQYLRDFSQMKSIKGSENYYCSKFRCNCSEGMQIGALKKEKCLPCNYKTARREYVESDLGVLNYHMFINYWMYSGEMMEGRGAKVLFVDECHSFEETYCDSINAIVCREYLAKADVWNDEWEQILPDVRTIAHFCKFIIDQVVPLITLKIKELDTASRDEEISDFEKVKCIKDIHNLQRMYGKYDRLIKDEENWRNNWIINIDKTKKDWVWKVEAIWAKEYLRDLWNKYDHVVFLSGTILDFSFFTKLMGCEPSESEYLTLDSPFPVENRMIVYNPVDKLSFANKDIAFKKMVPEIEFILSQHPNEKGIIHTANYELSKWLERDIEDTRLLFHDKDTKAACLNKHYASALPTILVSPSMINGIDLKDELSRFQVILKVPYPNLSSAKIKERMRTNAKWYSWKTLCEIIQSYGRSIRSEEDYAVTYILDENFGNLIEKVKIPKYLMEAIIQN